MSEQSRICAGATVGAVLGAAVAYLFLTEQGRMFRDRLEPAVDELIGEFEKFRGTIEKIGAMANDGLRALEEFQVARGNTQFPTGGTAH